MKFHHSLIAAITLTLVAGAFANDPQELKSARSAYQQSVQRATEPLKTRYVADLTRMRETYTRAGKLADAVAVENEIRALNGQAPVEMPAETAATPATAPGQAKTSGVISADSSTGLALGPAKKGQHIRVQYVEGTWTSSAGAAPVSPDDAPHPFAKVAVIGSVNGKEEVIMIVPSGTKARAFSDDFKKDYEQVWLRINDHTKTDNAGEVTYKASIR